MTISEINYDIQFEPIFSNFTFKGIEILSFKTTASNKFVLDCAEIKIQKCYILSKTKTIETKIKLDAKKETLSITSAKKVSGKIKLCIEFTGILNDRLLGFYRSKYADPNGKTKYMATTQFEAADARRAFPCWDEPATKATFDVSLLVEKNYMAISNMPVRKKQNFGSKIIYEFARTPIMLSLIHI